MWGERGAYAYCLSAISISLCISKFLVTRSNFDLFTRRVIRDLEGTSDLTEEILKPYTDPDSEKYKKMLEVMAEHLQLDSLKFQRLEDIVKAIGLPKDELCTHCWDNSSYMVKMGYF